MERDAGDSNRLATFDGMRGIAALLVALYHFQQARGGATVPGYLAVDLFFVLSGYVIAARYGPSLAAGMTLAGFCRSRLVRLYPLYAAGLVLGVIAQACVAMRGEPQALGPAQMLAALGFGVALLPDPFHATLFPLNGTAWSLFFELVVNLFFGAVLWRLPGRWLAAIALAAALVLAGCLRGSEPFNIGWNWESFPGGLARALASFTAGMLVLRWLPPGHRPQTLAAMLPLLAMTALILFAPHQAGWQFAIVLAFPLLVGWASRVEPPPGLRGAFARAGDLSYAVYAINLPLLGILRPALTMLPRWLGGGLFLLLVLGLAQLLTRWLDAPVRRALNARLGVAARARRLA